MVSYLKITYSSVFKTKEKENKSKQKQLCLCLILIHGFTLRRFKQRIMK